MKKPEADMNELIRRITEAGLRPSLQRIAILEYLQTHSNHPSVETIHSELMPRIPTLSRTTVYNTLKVLCDAGLVKPLHIDIRNQRFDGCTTPHHHFLCRQCGKVVDIPASTSDPKLPGGEVNVEHTEICYYGICNECRQTR